MGSDEAGRKGARRILRALIEGLDPATGLALDGREVVHRLEVMRALALGLEALAEVEGSGVRAAEAGRSERAVKRTVDRAGQGWERREDEALRHLFGQRRRVSDIALEMGRTTGAISSRLVRLGLVKERNVDR